MKLRFRASPIAIIGQDNVELRFIKLEISDGFLAVHQAMPADSTWQEMLTAARSMRRLILDELHQNFVTQGEYLQ